MVADVSFAEAVEKVGKIPAIALYLAKYGHLPEGAKISAYELSRVYDSETFFCIVCEYRKLIMQEMQKRAGQEQSFKGWQTVYFCIPPGRVNVRNNILRQMEKCADDFYHWQWLYLEAGNKGTEDAKRFLEKMLATAKQYSHWKTLADLDLDEETKQTALSSMLRLAKTPSDKVKVLEYYPEKSEERKDILAEIKAMEGDFTDWQALYRTRVYQFRRVALDKMLAQVKTPEEWRFLMGIAFREYPKIRDAVLEAFGQIEVVLDDLLELYEECRNDEEVCKLIIERVCDLPKSLELWVKLSGRVRRDSKGQKEALLQAAQFLAE